MKARESKLDPHAELLTHWFNESRFGGENITYAEARERLRRDHGLDVSINALCTWWQRQLSRAQQEKLLADITSGAQFNRQLEKSLGSNPPPELVVLITLIRTLIAQLAVQGSADPETLKLVGNLTALVVDYEKSRGSQELKLRELEQRASIAERQSADRRASLQLDYQKFELQFCDAVQKALADAQLRSLVEKKAGNAEIIAHLRQTYFSDIDALQQSGSVQLPT